MPDRAPLGNVSCPRCRTLLTSADRIPKTTLQALFTPNHKRYLCDSCGLKFTVAGDGSSKKQRTADAYDLPPLKLDMHGKVGKPDRPRSPRPRSRSRYVQSRPRTTRLHVTDVPDIPGIHNSADKAALKSSEQKASQMEQELERLRRIEKEYHRLKKANRYLAKASSQRR